MKMTFAFISIATTLLSACSGDQNNPNKNQDGTHLHEDGSVHTDHDSTTAPAQEGFSAEGDTTTVVHEPHSHSHGEGDHKH